MSGNRRRTEGPVGIMTIAAAGIFGVAAGAVLLTDLVMTLRAAGLRRSQAVIRVIFCYRRMAGMTADIGMRRITSVH